MIFRKPNQKSKYLQIQQNCHNYNTLQVFNINASYSIILHFCNNSNFKPIL